MTRRKGNRAQRRAKDEVEGDETMKRGRGETVDRRDDTEEGRNEQVEVNMVGRDEQEEDRGDNSNTTAATQT